MRQRREGSLVTRRVAFVRASPPWFAPLVTTVSAGGPSAESFDRPPPRHPTIVGPGARSVVALVRCFVRYAGLHRRFTDATARARRAPRKSSPIAGNVDGIATNVQSQRHHGGRSSKRDGSTSA